MWNQECENIINLTVKNRDFAITIIISCLVLLLLYVIQRNISLIAGVNLQNCTAGPFASGNNGNASRQRLIELSHGLGALRHYNDLANHVLSLNQQGAVVTKLLGS